MVTANKLPKSLPIRLHHPYEKTPLIASTIINYFDYIPIIGGSTRMNQSYGKHTPLHMGA